MDSEFKIAMKTVTCYRPTGQKELDLVAASDHRKWPPRLPDQPIFYPVTNEEYAIELTRWNVKTEGVGYVAKFEVAQDFLSGYKIECVGGKNHTEWWIPAEEMAAFNANIVGKIEVIKKLTKEDS